MAVIVNSNGGGYPGANCHVPSAFQRKSNFDVVWYETDSSYVQTVGVNAIAFGY